MLVLKDQWIWDFWTYQDGPLWHIWFLKADRTLGDENLRHWNVDYGHATSTDLENWHYLGTSFKPADTPSWDDKTVWTGSVMRQQQQGIDGVWHLFYTGTSQAENGKRQRIGHATSEDGHHWQRVGNGLILDLKTDDATSALYEEHHDGPWDGRAMRDPWVIKDPNGPGWLMYFTARINHGDELNTRGAIGLARSDDLYHWTLQPPVYAGADFGQLEVPQVFEINGRWYCLFCNAGEHWSQAYAARYAAAGHGSPVWGTHYLTASHPLGPWVVANGAFLDGATPCQRYAAKLLNSGQGLVLLAFNYWNAQGEFVGNVGDPMPVALDPETGQLKLA
jgi:beta-fructofuranosidase